MDFISRLFPLNWDMFFGKGFIEEEGGGSDDSAAGEGSPEQDPSGQGDGSLEDGGQEPEDQGEGEQKPQGDRSPKNWQAELKRKTEALDALKSEMAVIKAQLDANRPPEKQVDVYEAANSSDKARKSLEKLKAFGFDDDGLREVLNLIEYQSEVIASRKLAPLSGKFADGDLKEAVAELEQDEAKKPLIEKYRAEIKPMMIAEKINPELWGNKQIVDLILNKVVVSHISDFTKPQKRIDREISQEGRSDAGGSLPQGITAQELREYAEATGMDLGNPIVKKKAMSALAAKKRALKNES